MRDGAVPLSTVNLYVPAGGAPALQDKPVPLFTRLSEAELLNAGRAHRGGRALRLGEWSFGCEYHCEAVGWRFLSRTETRFRITLDEHAESTQNHTK